MKPLAEIPMGQDAAENFARQRVLMVTVPESLHVDSKRLVQEFASEMARKLKAAEEKYGYRNGWLIDDWRAECRRHLLEHMDKGDPRDVAIYAAFCWARGWSTAPEGGKPTHT